MDSSADQLKEPTLPALVDNFVHEATERNLEVLTPMLNELATASKTSQEARTLIGHTKTVAVLNNLLATTAPDFALPTDFAEPALRCLGNSCIDNDAARDVIAAENFAWARRCLRPLEEGGVRVLAVKVLYNLCTGHEGMRKACWDWEVWLGLESFLSTSGNGEAEGQVQIAYADKALALEVLCWAVGKRGEGEGADKVDLMLDLADKYREGLEVDDWGVLVETCLSFLRDPKVQKLLAEEHHLSLVWRLFEANEHVIARLTGEEKDEDRKLLVPVSVSLTWVLSDIAAIPPDNAGDYNPKEDVMTGTTVRAIKDPTAVSEIVQPEPRFVSAACQVLGNLLWNIAEKESFSSLVATDRIHEPLFEQMDTHANDADFMHSAAGLIIQLSRASPELRRQIGCHERAEEAIQKLCRHEKRELKEDGVKLLRALGKECPENQDRYADLAKETMVAVAQASADAQANEGQSNGVNAIEAAA